MRRLVRLSSRRPRLEAVTQLVELLDNDRRAGHVAAAHALAEVPSRDTDRLQITDLRGTVFATVY